MMASFTTQYGLAGIQIITVRSIGLVQIFKSSIEIFITHSLNKARNKYEGLKSRVRRGYQYVSNLLRGAGNLLPTICMCRCHIPPQWGTLYGDHLVRTLIIEDHG